MNKHEKQMAHERILKSTLN